MIKKMTHEFRDIVVSYLEALKDNKKCVVASLVDLDGSSYRRPGVRMLITEDGQTMGAISGGCIEKEVLRESVSVFNNGVPKMMTYDGRYRLGCEGIIYILLEVFHPSSSFIEAFYHNIDARKDFLLSTYYSRELLADKSLGSVAMISGKEFTFNQATDPEHLKKDTHTLMLQQKLPSMFRLVIIGNEYDAAKLSLQASLLGWEVIVVTNPMYGYTSANFPGSAKVLQANPDQLPEHLIDQNTAVVLMTHNYAKDLSYLLALKGSSPVYLGLLGPAKRRNKLFDDYLEHAGEIPESLFEVIHGPAGLNIGAETAEEIALSICSEIITILRDKDASHLNNLNDRIHASW